MNQFIVKYEDNTSGVLSGFDRLVLRGTIRMLAMNAGMMSFLRHMGVLLPPVCRPACWKGRRVRALQPWSPADRSLLQAVRRGEFAINGVRNRDLVALLSPGALHSPAEKRRASGRVTRQLRLLRAHGILRKAAHRYSRQRHGDSTLGLRPRDATPVRTTRRPFDLLAAQLISKHRW